MHNIAMYVYNFTIKTLKFRQVSILNNHPEDDP